MLIAGYPERKQIDVRVTGESSRRREALAVVRERFEEVHMRLPEVGAKLMVPLPDEPEFDVEYEHLRKLETLEGSEYETWFPNASKKYTIGELLDGVSSERIPSSPRNSDGVALPQINPGITIHAPNSAVVVGNDGISLGASASGSIQIGTSDASTKTQTAYSLPDRLQIWMGGGLVAFAVAAAAFFLGRGHNVTDLDFWARVGIVSAIGSAVGAAGAFILQAVRNS